jgi:Xaa-Pro dipeptidase
LNNTHYSTHIDSLRMIHEKALETVEAEGILLHSGSDTLYFADDRAIEFSAYGHYLRWIPINKPDQFLLFIPGETPRYFQVVPTDYWYDQIVENDEPLEKDLSVTRIKVVSDIKIHIKHLKLCYLGPCPDVATSLDISTHNINPQKVISYLDFQRAYKTQYEIAQVRNANKLALIGHRAARECFLANGNEYDIHMAYLRACNILESECPYTNIVALGEKSAILHYQKKRKGDAEKDKVLLIDAGCRVKGYASDITRTIVKENVNSIFKDLLIGMEDIERSLVTLVKPGVKYPELHSQALAKISELLLELSICSGSVDDLLEMEISNLFMPHGVGHLLGIQVHDVGGHQRDVKGAVESPPANSPYLRNTRIIAKDMIFTIEPGCYFIPILLEPQRDTTRGGVINWKVVEQLYPCGGVRIEDNILVTDVGSENLTRQFEAINQ